MSQWIQDQLIKLVLEMITDDKIDELAEFLKASVVPWLHEKKEELIEMIRVQADKTNTELDDIVVEKLDHFLDAFLPDTPSHL